jgi:nitronate monooxygenase
MGTNGSGREEPRIIQGGMGVGVSGWRLANAVSAAGQLGVVAGTALDTLLARRLQLGDPGGHMRRALAAFPVPELARRIHERFFVEGGKPDAAPYRAKPMPSARPSSALDGLLVAANFVEVFLAREGHDNPVGINYLTKVQAPTLPSLLGAMLAGVSCVCMGAGLPLAIPGILDRLSEGQPVQLALDVQGAERGEQHLLRLDPGELLGQPAPRLTRPRFLAIVSTDAVASLLLRKSSGRVDGFIVEAPSAGGHNAPPRGRRDAVASAVEPVYGPRDEPDLAVFRGFGLPFWLAGSKASPEGLAAARAEGAAGIQVGTAFAFCQESGLEPDLRARTLAASRAGSARVVTDPCASPTGFPFKVLQLEGTLSERALAEARARRCDLGYLRQAYRRDDGGLGWRCSGEGEASYEAKGGDPASTPGRACLCNALVANVGFASRLPDGSLERQLLTAGDEVAEVARFLAPDATPETGYRAADVLAQLLAPVGVPV